jgi:D-aspartate ligase
MARDRELAGSPPAVVLGGLSLVRALGRGGIPVVLASPGAHDPARSSRYVDRAVVVPPWGGAGEATLRALLAEGEALAEQTGHRLPLYYGNDDQLDWISRFAEPLAKYFLVLLNPPELGRLLMDKSRFYALARQRGILVPREFSWAHCEEIADHPGPVLIKPRDPQGWSDSPLRALIGAPAKARVFESGAALLALEEARPFRKDLVVQEYIPGGDEQICSFHGFADERGDLLAWFCGRKLRTFPRTTGESAFLELIHSDDVERVGRHVLGTLGLRGPFKMDFKRDARDGRLYLLEINARFNLWHYLGAVNGVNLPAVAYRYLVDGERGSPPSYLTRYRWLNLRLDLQALREQSEDSNGAFGPGTWLRSLLTRKVYRLFAWRDPGPFIQECMRAVTGRR